MYAGCSIAQTQQVFFSQVLGNDGISLGKVNSITQDRQGYIWLSDQDNGCIIRYDGLRMTSFRFDIKNPNSLGGTYPECLFADNSGMIWIGFYGTGLDSYDPETGIFTHFRHKPKDPSSLSNDTVTSVLMDHEGNLWVGTYGGLDLLDKETGRFRHYAYSKNDPSSLSCNKIRAVYEDHQGTIWVGTGVPFDNYNDGGLNRFDRKTGKFKRYLHHPDDHNSIVNNKVRALFEDSKGTFWVGTAGDDGLLKMNREKGTFERHPYNPNKPEQLSRPPVRKGDKFDHITFITEDGKGTIWIGTFSQGLIRYEPKTKIISRFNSSADKSSGFKDESGWCAFVSKEGVFWVSTQEKNLYRVDPFHNIIPHFSTAPFVTCFYEEPASNLWYGTGNDGLFRKDLKTGVTHQYKNDKRDIKSLSINNVNTIIKDPGGDLWLGTYGGGVNRLNLVTQIFTRYTHDPGNDKSLISDKVYTIYRDRESNLWVGTEDGCDVMEKNTGYFKHYLNNPRDTNSISRNTTSCFLEDSRNNFWVGTWNGGGLNLLNRRNGKFKHYLFDEFIASLYEDSKGVIWASTGSGLFQYNRKTDKFTLLDEKRTGINLSNAWGIVGDNQDNLWFCTSTGLIRLNRNRDKIIIYSKKNGVTGTSLSYPGCYKGPEGDIYLGDAEGYFAFRPDKLNYNPAPPVIALSSFGIAGKTIKPNKNGPLPEPLFNAKEIHLSYNQNVFSFDLTAMDYGNPEDNKIIYRLKNFDRDWITLGSEGKAAYYNVPPGKYIFEVKALNSNNGVWAGKSVEIIISPPFWRTWAAYFIYGLLIVLAIIGIDRFQRRRLVRAERDRTRDREMAQAKEIEAAYIELKNTQAQLIQQEKMASLGELTAGIAHEIQNLLNFVNNFSEVNAELIDEMKLELQAGNTEEAIKVAGDIKANNQKISNHGKRADAIVKGMLLHSRTSTGQKELTDINALTDEFLRLSYHGLRAKDKSFNAALNTDFDQSLEKVNIVSQDIGRVILNLITNAFYAVDEKKKQNWAGYEPTVFVITKRIDNRVLISVKDNGNGIPPKVLDKIFQPFFTTKPAGQGTGLGLSLAYDIVKAHGGELKVETKEGEGTEFIIQLLN